MYPNWHDQLHIPTVGDDIRIISHHNPNILVSGDSKQVVVLKSDDIIENQEFIDEPAIVGNIVEFIEGVREAFERREKEYGIQERRAR
jgi:hypothetical protein